MTHLDIPYSTVVELLTRKEMCTFFGARFVTRTGETFFYPYSKVLERAKSTAGILQSKGLEPGDRVGVILPTSIDFFDVFLGVTLAGGIPAALYPPFRLGRLSEYYDRTGRMLSLIGAKFLVVDRKIGKIIGPAVENVDKLRAVFNPEDLRGTSRWSPVSVEPGSPAFLQFSSGTTVDPKAVIVSHANLLSNLEMMSIYFRMYPWKVWPPETVSWLPLYHDMGLVGVMFTGLYLPSTITYIEPDVFIARPAIWLQTISKYRAGVSPAPQFAYNLCTNKIKDADMEGVDLSCWKGALNGAEQIDINGMKRFTKRFSRWGFSTAAMTPVYGLAEAVLAVTFSDLTQPPSIMNFDRTVFSEEERTYRGSGYKAVSVGSPLCGIEIRISDDRDRPIADGRIGTIMVRGPSVTSGYYADPEATAKTIREGWLDTGDLGFICKSNLYIAGRKKDVIIIRGQNIAPQTIETLAQDVQGIRAGCVAAVSAVVEGEGEQLIVLAEKDQRIPQLEEALIAHIRESVIAGTGISPHLIQILEPGALPRTSSGKIRRSEALEMLLSGTLEPPEKMGGLKLVKRFFQSHRAWKRFRLKRRG